MTRPSKRELESDLEDLVDLGEGGQHELTPKIEKQCSDAVVSVVYDVFRELLSIKYQHHDEIVNESDESLATERYLEVIKEKYDIEADANDDRRVAEALAELATNATYPNAGSADMFPAAMTSLVANEDIHTEDGTELADLIDADRVETAEHTLIRETYGFVARLSA